MVEVLLSFASSDWLWELCSWSLFWCRWFFVVLPGVWTSNLFGGGSRLWSREGLSFCGTGGRAASTERRQASLDSSSWALQCRVLVVEKLGYLLGRPFTARRRQGLIHSRAIESIPGGQQPRPAATRARRAGYPSPWASRVGDIGRVKKSGTEGRKDRRPRRTDRQRGQAGVRFQGSLKSSSWAMISATAGGASLGRPASW